MSGRSRHHEHFRDLHKQSMAIAKIETRPHTQQNGGSADRVLHEVLQIPREPTFWDRLFKWEKVSVAGKTVEKGFVVTPGIAAVLLAAFLGVLGWAYKSSTAESRETRDAIIRMETMLNERTTTFKERQQEMQNKLDNEIKLAEMRREQEATKRASLLATLRQKGIIID